jgi:hypothetical protein
MRVIVAAGAPPVIQQNAVKMPIPRGLSGFHNYR